MARLRRLAMVAVVAVSGCSRETLQRTGYETLRNIEQQQCIEQGVTPCPPREGYDAYQRQREELVAPEQKQ